MRFDPKDRRALSTSWRIWIPREDFGTQKKHRIHFLILNWKSTQALSCTTKAIRNQDDFPCLPSWVAACLWQTPVRNCSSRIALNSSRTMSYLNMELRTRLALCTSDFSYAKCERVINGHFVQICHAFPTQRYLRERWCFQCMHCCSICCIHPAWSFIRWKLTRFHTDCWQRFLGTVQLICSTPNQESKRPVRNIVKGVYADKSLMNGFAEFQDVEHLFDGQIHCLMIVVCCKNVNSKPCIGHLTHT